MLTFEKCNDGMRMESMRKRNLFSHMGNCQNSKNLHVETFRQYKSVSRKRLPRDANVARDLPFACTVINHPSFLASFRIRGRSTSIDAILTPPPPPSHIWASLLLCGLHNVHRCPHTQTQLSSNIRPYIYVFTSCIYTPQSQEENKFTIYLKGFPIGYDSLPRVANSHRCM